METNELIEALAADTRRTTSSLSSVWWGAAGLAVILAAAVFFATAEPRPDFMAAADTPRFLFKFVVTITLAASAFSLARALSRPGESWRQFLHYLAAAPALAAMATMAELFVLPPSTWAVSLIGTNSLVCLISILLIGIGPLAIFLLALRYGAPTRPALAGAVAGLAAGGIAAAFYAVRCTDDSPLFIATWYTMAIAGLALLGAGVAHRFARW
jgi:hypothetical protein